VLDRAGIATRIPHQGSMCLLDSAVAWDDAHIHCRAASHAAQDNPLRADGRLGAATGIEYAAQAMALHGALLASPDGAARQGYLASVRKLQLHTTRLDDLPGQIDIRAERLSGDSGTILYQFRLEHAGRTLLEGRAVVVMDADRPSLEHSA